MWRRRFGQLYCSGSLATSESGRACFSTPSTAELATTDGTVPVIDFHQWRCTSQTEGLARDLGRGHCVWHPVSEYLECKWLLRPRDLMDPFFIDDEL